MYKIGEKGGLFASMPPNMQDAKTEALCYAVERQARRVRELAERMNVWSNLKHVKGEHLDYVAACLRAMYYKSELPDEEKREIIQSTLMTYRYAGSVRAVEELLKNLFTDAEFIPWYEYGGLPYHFKIGIGSQLPDVGTKKVLESILRKVKAARSVVDAVEIKERTDTKLCRIGIGALSVRSFVIGKGKEIKERTDTKLCRIRIGALSVRSFAIGRGK